MDHFHALEFINKNYKSYQKNSLIKEKDFDVIYVQGRCEIVFNTDQFVQIRPIYSGNKIHITSNTFSFIFSAKVNNKL